MLNTINLNINTMAENLVNDIRDKIKNFKNAKVERMENDANVNASEFIVNREMLENFKNKKDVGVGFGAGISSGVNNLNNYSNAGNNAKMKANLLSEIKNSILMDGNSDFVNNANINQQENGSNYNNTKEEGANQLLQPITSINSIKDVNFAPKNEILIKDNYSLGENKEAYGLIPKAKSNFIKIEENIKIGNNVETRSSSNGKVQELKNEFLNLFDSDKKERNNIKYNTNANTNIPINMKKVKNISLYDNPIPKNESNRTAARRDKPLSFVEADYKSGNLGNDTTSIATGKNVKDKIKSFVYNFEKDGINANLNLNVNVYQNKKNKSNSNIRDYFSPSITAVKKNATIDYASNLSGSGKNRSGTGNASNNTNDSVLGSRSKMNNYLSLISPKEINLYGNINNNSNHTKDYGNRNGKVNNIENAVFKVEDVKSLANKLKFLTEKEVKKLDSNYTSELKNLANVINKLFR